MALSNALYFMTYIYFWGGFVVGLDIGPSEQNRWICTETILIDSYLVRKLQFESEAFIVEYIYNKQHNIPMHLRKTSELSHPPKEKKRTTQIHPYPFPPIIWLLYVQHTRTRKKYTQVKKSRNQCRENLDKGKTNLTKTFREIEVRGLMDIYSCF